MLNGMTDIFVAFKIKAPKVPNQVTSSLQCLDCSLSFVKLSGLIGKLDEYITPAGSIEVNALLTAFM